MMEPGYYIYTTKTGRENVIAVVFEEMAGMANCVCLYPNGAHIYFHTQDMLGEWEKKIEMETTRKPAEVLHPGEHLRDELKARGIDNLGIEICFGLDLFDDIVNLLSGKGRITDEMARILANGLDTSPNYWLNLQRAWDERSKEELRDKILAEEKKGNIVFWAIDELAVANLDNFITQPVEGILYDLNRLPEVVLTFIDDRKWINDYAVYLVIKRLKEELEKERSK